MIPTPIPSSAETPQSPAAPAARASARSSRAVMVILPVDGGSAAQVAVLDGKAENVAQAKFLLDGALSHKQLKAGLRELGWKASRLDSAWLVAPAADALVTVEEYPSANAEEVKSMAEGQFHAMVELDPQEHVPAFQILHRGAARTVAALAIFERKRLERLFGLLQALGLSNARFALDAAAAWQAGGAQVRDGWWGQVRVDEGRKAQLAVCILHVADGVIRGMRQGFFQRLLVDEAFLEEAAAALIPGDAQVRGAVQWSVLEKDEPLVPLAEVCRLAAQGGLIGFEMEPAFWKEQQRRLRRRQNGFRGFGLAAALYLGGLLALAGWSFWQWREDGRLRETLQKQETAWREADSLKRQIKNARQSSDLSGSALEILRQLTENRPKGMIFESFQYRLNEGVKVRGTALQSEQVYDYLARLKKIPAFRQAKNDSINSDQAGKVTWQINIPLQPVPSS
ncbi:MAG: hypothetical protein PHV34_09555 [Verrucomicrobiae bacterium]|nr:hypothetical protein [Verrucomicrobiae bacterium]